MSSNLLTAEQFAETLFDLPEAGRWHELIAGEVEMLEPPDDLHGNIVLNLSKAIGEYLATRCDSPVGYACFDLGLVVSRNPDTVYRPAVSFFAGESSFAESDSQVTETVPTVVFEAASSPMRRRSITERVERYHRVGVDRVLVGDPEERAVHVCPRNASTRRLSESDELSIDDHLPGFTIPVQQVFADPSWWNAGN